MTATSLASVVQRPHAPACVALAMVFSSQDQGVPCDTGVTRYFLGESRNRRKYLFLFGGPCRIRTYDPLIKSKRIDRYASLSYADGQIIFSLIINVLLTIRR